MFIKWRKRKKERKDLCRDEKQDYAIVYRRPIEFPCNIGDPIFVLDGNKNNYEVKLVNVCVF